MTEPPPDAGKAMSAALFPLPANGPLRAVAWADGHQQKAPPDLVKGLIAKGLNLAFGASSSGKTFLALDLAVAVARGQPWRDRRVRGGPVLYIAAEAAAGIWKRLAAIRAEAMGEEEPYPPLYVVDRALDLLGSPDDVRGLVAEAKRCGAALIVLDTVSRVFGAGDENSTSDMAAFVATLDRVMTETGAAVLLVHHTGKDSSKGARGSSVLHAAADAVIEVERPGDGNPRRATLRKSRDGEDGASYDFRLRVVDLGEDDDGDPVTSCVVEPEGAAGAAPRRAERLPTSQRIALDALRTAIIAAGEVPPASNQIPRETRAVPMDLWKRYAIEKGVCSSSESASQWAAFKRASEALIARHAVGRWGEWVWSA